MGNTLKKLRYNRNYRKKHRQRCNEYTNKWRKKIIGSDINYYEKHYKRYINYYRLNKNKINTNRRLHRKNNPLIYRLRDQLHDHKRYDMEKKVGLLKLETIQKVYEDNIKKHGTLTCYLCFKPVKFKQDSLEHKIPLSRGGTNEYENLNIAHRTCNSKKHNKTEIEYRKLLKERAYRFPPSGYFFEVRY